MGLFLDFSRIYELEKLITDAYTRTYCYLSNVSLQETDSANNIRDTCTNGDVSVQNPN